MTDERPATAWGSIAVLFACGVVAAMQMGRTVAIPTLLIESLGLSLAALGWAFSMITAVAAAGGLLAGGALQRLGIQRAMPFGLIWLSGSIALGSFATTGGWMLAGRALEGVGYLAIVVAAPTLMSVLAAPKHRPVVLAVWATFVPAGDGSPRNWAGAAGSGSTPASLWGSPSWSRCGGSRWSTKPPRTARRPRGPVWPRSSRPWRRGREGRQPGRS